MKYTYTISNNKVYCVSHYAGKAVRGVAKCDESYDKFDAKIGMQLAKLRCDKKIAKKRVKNMIRKLNNAIEVLIKAQNTVDNLSKLAEEASGAYNNLEIELNEFENKLNNNA